jgi:hypothetical protein
MVSAFFLTNLKCLYKLFAEKKSDFFTPEKGQKFFTRAKYYFAICT